MLASVVIASYEILRGRVRLAGMTSEQVHFSQFCAMFNMKLTQFNIISPCFRCKVAMHDTDGNMQPLDFFVSIVGRIICPLAI